MKQYNLSFRSSKDWAAFKETLQWCITDERIRIRRIIQGYSTDWKVEHWDEWKKIRDRYYEEKKLFYSRYGAYMKQLTSQTSKVYYADVDESMVGMYVKKSILTDGIEKIKDPLCIETRTGKGRIRRRYITN